MKLAEREQPPPGCRVNFERQTLTHSDIPTLLPCPSLTKWSRPASVECLLGRLGIRAACD